MQPATDASKDRTTRYLHDADGRQVGALDGEGYLSEFVHDAAGRVVSSRRYATPVPAALRPQGSLAELRKPLLDARDVRDIITVNLYDGQGRLVAEVDGENHLTEWVYDTEGRRSRQIRHHPALTVAVTPASRLSDIRPAPAPGREQQVTAWTYDALGRLESQTDPDGTATLHQYDRHGRLTSTTRAFGTAEARSVNARYDAVGNLVGELSAEGAALLTIGQSWDQVEAIWAAHGVSHAYDNAGRRIRTTDANGLATRFHYDTDGRLTHTVNAEGEVEVRRYNGLGQLTSIVQHAKRLQSHADLRGGFATADMQSRVDAVADADHDARTVYEYDSVGRLWRTSVGFTATTSGVTTSLYNAFGEEVQRTQTTVAGKTRTDIFTHDRRGWEATATTDAAGTRPLLTRTSYDAFGRLESTTDAMGRVRSLQHDRLGRLVAMTDALGERTRTTYDAFDRILSTFDELGHETRFSHDTARRTVRVTTPEGVALTTTRDRHGMVVAVEDSAGQVTRHRYDRNGNLRATTTPLTVTESRFDNANRLIETTDANGVKVTYRHDAANRVVRRTVDPTELDPNGLNLVTEYRYDGRGQQVAMVDPRGVVTTVEFDKAGRQVLETVDDRSGGLRLQTRYSHDAQGRVLTVTNPRGVVTRYVYDAAGRRLSEEVDVGGLALSTTYAHDANGNVVARTDANGHVTRFAYDAENRLVFTVDALGGTTHRRLDDAGRVVRTTRYAEPLADLSNLPTPASVRDIEQRIVATPGKDAVEARVLDRDGRLRFEVDGMGAVVEYVHDAVGNVSERRAYAQPIALASWDGVTPPVVVRDDARDQRIRTRHDSLNRATHVADALGGVTQRVYDGNGNVRRLIQHATPILATQRPADVVASAADRVQVFEYDEANREVWRADAAGAVVASEYDGAGNVVRTTAFARSVAAGASPATVQPDAGRDRITRLTYDAANRRTYRVDALDHVTAWRYETDAVGYFEVETRHATPIATGADPRTVAPSPSDQVDVVRFDRAGRRRTHIDALGKAESYGYDALGHRTVFTDRNNRVWTYQYDAAGRLKRETTPPLRVTATSLVDGIPTEGTTSVQNVVTEYHYDALGNLKRRIEALGLPEQRETGFDHDARGYQTRIIHPAVAVYSGESATQLAGNGLAGPAARAESAPVRLVTQTFYDALGQAVANIDTAGQASYRAYDAAGRLRYEVDALGHVTGHERNTFGDVEGLRRYAVRTTLADSPPADASGAPRASDIAARVNDAVVDHSLDRLLTTRFDALGRAVEVIEPAAYHYDSLTGTDRWGSRITRHEYDALGRLRRTSVVGTAAVTTHYHDRLDRVVATVDALGHLTERRYDDFGNLEREIEYARPLAAGSWTLDHYAQPTRTASDRTVTHGYDALNRKTRETRVQVEFSTASDGTTAAPADVTTTYGYDAVGNRVRSTDALGNSTYTYHDALGRIRSVAEPARTSGPNGGLTIPVTHFRRDALGNVVVQLRLGAQTTAVSESVAPLDTTGSRDRRTVTRFDALGRAIHVSEADGSQHFQSHDALGRLAKRWQTVAADEDGDGSLEAQRTVFQAFQYDRLGRVVHTLDPAPFTDALAPDATRVTDRSVDYNAFGEIVRKGLNGTWTEFFDIDSAGRVWRTNSGDGIVKVLLHDVLGRNTAEIRNAGGADDVLDLGSRTLATGATAQTVVEVRALATAPGTRRTEYLHDALGRVVEQRQPLRMDQQGGVGVKTQSTSAVVRNSERPIVQTSDSQQAIVAWGGMNEVGVAWRSLASLGSGDVQVTLHYKTLPYDTGAVQVDPASGSPYPVIAPAVARTITRTFAADVAVSGTDLVWADQHGISEAVRMVVQKKDLEGTWRTIVDQPGFGLGMNTLEVTAPADISTVAWVEIQPTVPAGQAWKRLDSPVHFGSKLQYDVSSLTGGSYNYKLFTQRSGAQVLTSSSGTFTISRPTLTAIGVPIALGQGGTAPHVLAWQSPGSGYVQTVNVRPAQGNGEWTRFTATSQAPGYDGVSLAVLPAGDHEFELIWSVGGAPQAFASGTVRIVTQVEHPAQGVPNLANLALDVSSLSWDATIAGQAINGTPVFEWRLAGQSTWNPGPAVDRSSTTRHRVTTSQFSGGAHQFRVVYRHNGVDVATATLDATLATVPVPQVSLATGLQVLTYVTTADTLSWLRPSASTSFESRRIDSAGQPLSAWVRRSTSQVDSRGVVSLAGLEVGRHEFRLVTEQAGGRSLTIGASTLTIHPTQPGFTQPAMVSNFDVEAVQGFAMVTATALGWAAPITTTGVPVVEVKAWNASTWQTLAVEPGLTRASTQNLAPNDYDVRISYSVGGALNAFGAAHLKVFERAPTETVLSYSDTSTSSGTVISQFWIDGTRLVWPRPAAATGTAEVVLRSLTGPSWGSPVAVVTGSTNDSINLPSAGGSYEFRVTYRNSGLAVAIGRGTFGVATASSSNLTLNAGQAAVTGSTVDASLQRLRWTRPATGGLPRFSYRIANTTGSWSTLDVTALDASRDQVLFGRLGRGTYDYTIVYNDPSTGVATSLGRGQFSTAPAGLSTDGQSAMPDPSWLAISGRTLSWPKLNAATVRVDQHVLGTDAWQRLSAVGDDGLRNSVNLGPTTGVVDYRISYTDAAGAVVGFYSFRIDSPSATLSPRVNPTAPGIPPSSFASTSTSISWQAVTSRATILVRPANTTTWSSDLGSRLSFDPVTRRHRIDTTGLTQAYDIRVLYQDSSGVPQSLDVLGFLPPQSLWPVDGYAVGGVSQLASGQGFEWTTAPRNATSVELRLRRLDTIGAPWFTAPSFGFSGNIYQSSAVSPGDYEYRLIFKDAAGLEAGVSSGVWHTNWTAPSSSAISSTITSFTTQANQLSWPAPGPATQWGEPRFQYRSTSNPFGAWTSGPPISTTTSPHAVDITALVGDFDVRVVYERNGEITNLSTGQIRRTQVPGTPPASDDRSRIGIASITLSRLTLSGTPVGITRLYLRPVGTPSYVEATGGGIDPATGRAYFFLPSPLLASTSYDYLVVNVAGDGTQTVQALASGRFVTPATTTSTPPLVDNTNPARVESFRLETTPSPRLLWPESAMYTGVPTFEMRRVNALAWDPAVTPTLNNGQRYVDLPQLTAQDAMYEFRLTYRTTSRTVSAIGAGTLRTYAATPASTPKPTVTDNAPVSVEPFEATQAWLTWKQMPGKARLEFRPIDATTWQEGAVRIGVTAGRDGIDTSALSGSYEFRITYADSIGQISALSAGTVTFTARANPTWTITTPAYVAPWVETLSPPRYSVTLTTGSFTAPLSVNLGTTLSQVAQQQGSSDPWRPVLVQEYDRWGNVTVSRDPRNAGWATHYTWNYDNRMLSRQQPSPTGPSADAPLTRWYYDALGRQVAVRDANQQVHGQQVDAGGNIVAELHADGGEVRYYYDAFSQKVASLDAESNRRFVDNSIEERARRTVFGYDNAGRLTKVTRPVVTSYTMSSALTLGAGVSAALITEYRYDAAGRRIAEIDANGLVTRHRYDHQGRVIETRLAPAGSSGPGRFVSRSTHDAAGNKTSETDANGRTATWASDAFGRLTSRTDLGGARVSHQYDRAGQLIRQESTAGQRLVFTHDAAGQLVAITDTDASGPNGSAARAEKRTLYAYDASGRRVLERTLEGGVVHQDNHLAYDALGRLRLVADGHLTMEFGYDAVGNRKLITTRLSIPSSADLNAPETPTATYRHFQYDAMNRVTVADAIDVQGTLGADGHAVRYDVNGNRVSDTFFDKQTHREVTETYDYDSHDRLLTIQRDGAVIDTRAYDRASRVLQSGTWNGPRPAGVKELQTRQNHFDALGRLLRQKVTNHDDGATQDTNYTGFDAVGNVNSYTIASSISQRSVTRQYSVNHIAREGYLQGLTTVLDQGKQSTITHKYDGNGHLIGLDESLQQGLDRQFTNDASGRALTVHQREHVERQFVVNGEVLGRYGVAPDALKPKTDAGDWNFVPLADFAFGFRAISKNYPAATPGTYTVRAGDSLQAIAHSVYGDSRQWYRIAEANHIEGDSDLRVGHSLTLPATVSSANRDDTFEPYDPSKVAGDLMPTLPPPRKEQFGTLSKIIGQVVFAILSTMMPTPVAAMLADVVRQYSQAALNGNLDHEDMIKRGSRPHKPDKKHPPGFVETEYDYKATLIAGASSWVGGQAGNATGNAALDAIVQRAVTNVAAQALSMATGRQSRFEGKSFVHSALGIPQDGADAFAFALNAYTQPPGPYDRHIERDDFGNVLGNSLAYAETMENSASEKFRQHEIRDQDSAPGGRWTAPSDSQANEGEHIATPFAALPSARPSNALNITNGVQTQALEPSNPAFEGESVQRVVVKGQQAPWYDRIAYRLQNMFDPESNSYVNWARDLPFLGAPSRLIGGIDAVLRGPAGYEGDGTPVYWNDRVGAFQGPIEIALDAGTLAMLPTPGPRAVAGIVRNGIPYERQPPSLHEPGLGARALGNQSRDPVGGIQLVPNATLERDLVLRGDAARSQIVGAIGEAAQPSIHALLRLDPSAKVGFRGSLASGLKGEHKLDINGHRVAFDGEVAFKFNTKSRAYETYHGPQGYDADFFVVSDKLAGQFGSTRRGFLDAADLDDGGLRAYFNSFGRRMQSDPLLMGMKHETPTFRVWSEQQMARKFEVGDSPYFFLTR